MIITHASISDNWNCDFENSETLILGSFNPNNPNGNTDYFYGRKTNYFWRAIAELNNLHPDIFFDNLELKIEYMRINRFCFLDLINSIEINTNSSQNLLNEFAEKKIFKEFTDQILFTSKTNFKGCKIQISRNYNFELLNLVRNSNINKIAHTLGNNRINNQLITSPIEKNLNQYGFQSFIYQIQQLENINFISNSISPSGYAVNTGGEVYFEELKNWLRGILFFN
jgi:hypothetical protein